MRKKNKLTDEDYMSFIWILFDLFVPISLAFVFPLWKNILLGIAVVIAILLVIRFYWKRKK